MLGRIRRHLRNPESEHRRIASGFLWVAVFVLFGKLAGAAKEIAIAWRYGISETVDVYVFVYNLVTWLPAVWFGIISIVLIPLVAGMRQDNPAALPRFRGELLGLALLIAVTLMLVLYWGLPAILQQGWAGLTGDALTSALAIVSPMTMLVPLGVLISLFSTWLMAHGRHRNTLFEALPALVILAALLAPQAQVPEPLIWGTIAGFTVHLAVLVVHAQQLGELQAPRFCFTSPVWNSFWASIGIMAAGQLLMSFTTIIDQFFASHLGAGAISTLNYANRILALLLGLGATAIGRATLPVLSRVQTVNPDDARRLTHYWAIVLFATGVMTTVLGWWLAPLAAKLLFERGAFTAQDTQMVAEVLRYGLLRVPFYFSGLILVSLLAAQHRYRAIALVAFVNILIKVGALIALTPYLGVNGIALSTSVMYLASSIFLYLLVKRNTI